MQQLCLQTFCISISINKPNIFSYEKNKIISTLTGQLVMLKVIYCLKICTCQINCLYCVEEMNINSLIGITANVIPQ